MERNAITDPRPGDVLKYTRTNRWGADVTRFHVTRRENDTVWFTVEDGSYEARDSVSEWSKRRAGCEVVSFGKERNSQ